MTELFPNRLLTLQILGAELRITQLYMKTQGVLFISHEHFKSIFQRDFTTNSTKLINQVLQT